MACKLGHTHVNSDLYVQSFTVTLEVASYVDVVRVLSSLFASMTRSQLNPESFNCNFDSLTASLAQQHPDQLIRRADSTFID